MQNPLNRLIAALLFCVTACFLTPAQADEGALTYDLGVTAGSANYRNYTEAELGLNYYLLDYLAWRNAVFYRFNSGYRDNYGLDTSLRLVGSLGGSAVGFSVFAGPGFRFINEGANAPFAEAGAAIKVAGFALGGGVKSLFNSAVDPRMQNDTMVFLIIAGAGSL